MGFDTKRMSEITQEEYAYIEEEILSDLPELLLSVLLLRFQPVFIMGHYLRFGDMIEILGHV